MEINALSMCSARRAEKVAARIAELPVEAAALGVVGNTHGQRMRCCSAHGKHSSPPKVSALNAERMR